jgi:hypothetical protein
MKNAATGKEELTQCPLYIEEVTKGALYANKNKPLFLLQKFAK